MSMSDQPKASSIVERAKNIILSPDAEWDKIDGEQTTVQKLYTEYVAILALIPALAGALGGLVFGVWGMGVRLRLSISDAVGFAVARYAMALLSVAVVALIIDALAPTFAGTRNRVQAFKVVGYAYTAAWLAGIFLLVPGLHILSLLGLYSVYLLYRGLPKLMKTPPDKALAYTAVVVIAALVVIFALGLLLAPFMYAGMGGGMGRGGMGGMGGMMRGGW